MNVWIADIIIEEQKTNVNKNYMKKKTAGEYISARYAEVKRNGEEFLKK